MRIMKKTIPFLITFLVVAAGLCMPRVTTLYLNYNLRTQVNQIENKDISLDLTDSANDIDQLLLFSLYNSDPYTSMVELSPSSSMCKLKEERVRAVAAEISGQLHFIDDIHSAPAVTAHLFIRSLDDKSVQSRVYWHCVWYSPDNDMQTIWIDDNTEKMVGLTVDRNNRTSVQSEDANDDSDSEQDVPQEINQLAEYCLKTYQIDDVVCRSELDGCYIIELIVYQNQEKYPYPVWTYMQDDVYLYFNM